MPLGPKESKEGGCVSEDISSVVGEAYEERRGEAIERVRSY